MVPSTRCIRVFGAVEEQPLRVDASECSNCGQLVPAEGAVENALRSFDMPTQAPAI
jgi:hypothetical protein